MTTTSDRSASGSLAGIFLASLLGFSAMIVLVEWSVGIHFETNDDVSMMMMAHGFGVAAHPGPMLLFSNVWQGGIIGAMGWPFGRSGYGLYLMGMLAVALAAIVGFLSELNGRIWANVLVGLAVSIRPVFAPQFTIIAGFLAIAAFLALAVYVARPRIGVLLAAIGLALAAVLMRDHMLLMAGMIVMPFLLRRSLRRDARAWMAGLVVLGFALLARSHHAAMLDAPEWAAFLAQNVPRAMFTDFQLGPRILADAEAMRVAGWSPNDVRLISMWWLGDPILASHKPSVRPSTPSACDRSFVSMPQGWGS